VTDEERTDEIEDDPLTLEDADPDGVIDPGDLIDPDGVIDAVKAGGLVGDRAEGGLTYDCTTWSGESRSLFDSLLSSAGVRHTWQGTVVGVAVDDEDRVDAIIDEVMAAASAALDPGRDKVAYEIGTWSASLQSTVAEALAVADIAYEWDVNGDLVIYADDEERAEEIFDGLPDPDDPELSSDDGVAVQDLLSTMFVAAGQLAKKPTDADAVLHLAETTDEVERLSLPFGFEPAVWKNLVAQASTLRDGLAEADDSSELSDDELKERASALRTTLRRFV
jgi:hypothetical protein